MHHLEGVYHRVGSAGATVVMVVVVPDDHVGRTIASCYDLPPHIAAYVIGEKTNLYTDFDRRELCRQLRDQRTYVGSAIGVDLCGARRPGFTSRRLFGAAAEAGLIIDGVRAGSAQFNQVVADKDIVATLGNADIFVDDTPPIADYSVPGDGRWPAYVDSDVPDPEAVWARRLALARDRTTRELDLARRCREAEWAVDGVDGARGPWRRAFTELLGAASAGSNPHGGLAVPLYAESFHLGEGAFLQRVGPVVFRHVDVNMPAADADGVVPAQSTAFHVRKRLPHMSMVRVGGVPGGGHWVGHELVRLVASVAPAAEIPTVSIRAVAERADEAQMVRSVLEGHGIETEVKGARAARAPRTGQAAVSSVVRARRPPR